MVHAPKALSCRVLLELSVGHVTCSDSRGEDAGTGRSRMNDEQPRLLIEIHLHWLRRSGLIRVMAQARGGPLNTVRDLDEDTVKTRLKAQHAGDEAVFLKAIREKGSVVVHERWSSLEACIRFWKTGDATF